MVVLTAIRTTLRVLPPRLRERLAVRLFMTPRSHTEPPREVALRKEGDRADFDGYTAVRFGPPDAPAILLMHGWEGRGLQMGAYIAPLVAAGNQVIAIDGPGHGHTKGGTPGLPTFSICLERALSAFSPVAIVAHSMGAGAALVAASRSGFQGRVLCLAGPPETHDVFTRARAFMRLPESGRERFYTYLRQTFAGIPLDDVMGIEACASRMKAEIHAVLAHDDDEFPFTESERIIEAGGGTVEVMSDVTHRSVMWDPTAVARGVTWLLR
jgi:pimeloyl-ACP methyl ester carboxylesterase